MFSDGHCHLHAINHIDLHRLTLRVTPPMSSSWVRLNIAHEMSIED